MVGFFEACDFKAAERTAGWAPDRRVRRVWPCGVLTDSSIVGERELRGKKGQHQSLTHSRADSTPLVGRKQRGAQGPPRLTLRRMKYGTASTSKDSEMSGKASASICHHAIISQPSRNTHSRTAPLTERKRTSGDRFASSCVTASMVLQGSAQSARKYRTETRFRSAESWACKSAGDSTRW